MTKAKVGYGTGQRKHPLLTKNLLPLPTDINAEKRGRVAGLSKIERTISRRND